MCPRSPAQQTTAPTDNSKCGRALHLLLLRDGHKPTKHCPCTRMAAEMDRNGLEWCKANKDKPIDTMVAEAKRQGSRWPKLVLRRGAERYVEAAIKIGERRVRVPPADPKRLAVIVPLFNPAGYDVFYGNMDRCVEGLLRQGAEVFVAEAVYPGQEQRVAYASHVYYPPSPMFHKESIVQAALQTLPPEYDAVAWVDADLIFENENWVQETLEQLRKKPVLQPFSQAHWLDRQGNIVKEKRWSAGVCNCKTNHPGFAWAARRSLLDKHGIYTHAIAGSGDSFWTCAVYGWHNRTNHYLRHWHDPTLSTFLPWAEAIYKDVRGQVGCAQGTVKHLPHGNAAGRQYATKFKIVDSLKYDPSRHVHVGPSGLLEWTDEAPQELRDFLVEFFAERNDDVLV